MWMDYAVCRKYSLCIYCNLKIALYEEFMELQRIQTRKCEKKISGLHSAAKNGSMKQEIDLAKLLSMCFI